MGCIVWCDHTRYDVAQSYDEMQGSIIEACNAGVLRAWVEVTRIERHPKTGTPVRHVKHWLAVPHISALSEWDDLKHS